jgi:Prion-inhibition and propagation
MEPVAAIGIATGVLGLIPLCSSGFEMITACSTASKDVRSAMTLITVQKYLFINWALSLRIKDLSVDAAGKVLEKRVSNWTEIGPGVYEILAAISDSFADVKALEDSYGLCIRSEEKIDRVICSPSSRTSIIGNESLEKSPAAAG